MLPSFTRAPGAPPFLIAGPCVIESEALCLAIAEQLKAMGCNAYRASHNPPTPELLAHAQATQDALEASQPGATLAANMRLWTDVRAHVAAGRPVLAECGGMMSLLDAVVDKAGVEHAFAGVLPGRAVMQTRLAALGHLMHAFGIDPASLIHALQNHDELTVELVHFWTLHAHDMYLYKGQTYMSHPTKTDTVHTIGRQRKT